MRILIYGMNYAPELTGIGKYTGEMAEWLARRGHHVCVIAAPPFSPSWRVYDGFSGSCYRRETSSGTSRPEVLRCPIWVPSQPAGWNRLLHLMSFAVSSLPALITRIAWRPDIVWVVEPSCLMVPTALFVGWLSGAKTWLHVQDFEVEMALSMGLVPRHARSTAVAIEKLLKRAFDRVSTISENMIALLKAKSVRVDRCVLFPNWVDTDRIFPLPTPSRFRAELGIPESDVVALYSGNMARKQGIELLIEAVRQLSTRSGIHTVICGDGPARAVVEQLAGTPNVHLLPLQPMERLNDLLNLADIHLLPQRSDAADLVMPSKLTGMLASGRPVIATAVPGTQVARVVESCGVVVPPEDSQALSTAIARLAAQPEVRRELGRNAREYAVAHLSLDKVLSAFEHELESLCAAAPLIKRSASAGNQPS